MEGRKGSYKRDSGSKKMMALCFVFPPPLPSSPLTCLHKRASPPIGERDNTQEISGYKIHIDAHPTNPTLFVIQAHQRGTSYILGDKGTPPPP